MIRFENGSVRYLSTYEAKLIQTFPKDFVISGAWGEAMRQIGNAVPVKLSEVIAKNLYQLLNMPLRNVPTNLMKNLDYGKDYRHTHDDAGSFAAVEQYMPVDQSLEIRITERLRSLQAPHQERQAKP